MPYLFGIFLSLFLALILIGKKGKTQADLILCTWLIAIGSHLLLFYLRLNNTDFDYPVLLGWLFPMPLLHWPFLYLYISSLTSKNRLNYTFLLHFLPFVASFALLANYFFLPADTKIQIYKNEGKGFETQVAVIFIEILISATVYITLSILKVWKYKKSFKNEFSNIEKINLQWLQFTILGMIGIFLVVLTENDRYIYLSVCCFVLFIGYFGIKQVGVFNQNKAPEKKPEPGNDAPESQNSDTILREYTESTVESTITESEIGGIKKVKYAKSKISNDQIQNIHRELMLLMSQELIYKNPELTLSDVAKKLQIHPNTLSQVINTVEQSNFYDFINQHRIEYFKKIALLPKNKHYTLLSLAFECGFNSKTSFNRNFKKNTNLSPSEYLGQKNIHLDN